MRGKPKIGIRLTDERLENGLITPELWEKYQTFIRLGNELADARETVKAFAKEAGAKTPAHLRRAIKRVVKGGSLRAKRGRPVKKVA